MNMASSEQLLMRLEETYSKSQCLMSLYSTHIDGLGPVQMCGSDLSSS